jgi:hypothetical protein
MSNEPTGEKRREERNPVTGKRDGLRSARDSAAGQVRKTGKAAGWTAKRAFSATKHRRNV